MDIRATIISASIFIFSAPMFGAENTATTYKKPSTTELQAKLTPMQFNVTQKSATESPFKNEYWDSKEPEIFVDVVQSGPLFSSLDKYDSGTGWPSFKKPINPSAIITKDDSSLFSKRTEVRSALANSHLGHVFDDGPKPLGLRYCMNSAAFRFIPVSELKKEGYSDLLPLFTSNDSSGGKASTASSAAPQIAIVAAARPLGPSILGRGQVTQSL